MKALFQDNRIFLFELLSIVVIWRLISFIPQLFGGLIIPTKIDFLGVIPWANFDGVHYLSIAENGYSTFQQAFFPFFPLFIKSLGTILNIGNLNSALIIAHLSLLFAVYFLVRLVSIDYPRKTQLWSVIFFLLFPTSFFLVSIYTESLFLASIFGSFYFARKGNFLTASILAGIASATRFVGIFMIPALLLELYIQKKGRVKIFSWQYLGVLVIPLAGLISYMGYLLIKFKDPLLFIKSQTAFGAGRSGGEIILLPQVAWRYIKIFITVPLSNYTYWIALLEATVFIAVLVLIWIGYRRGIRKSYILFSVLAFALPTLSGTLSSIPRYALVVFPVFILLALFESKIIRYTALLVGIVLQLILAMLFLQGYFVS